MRNQANRRMITTLCAAFLFSVSTLAMTDSRNKGDKSGAVSSPSTYTTGSTTVTPMESTDITRDAATGTSADSARGTAPDTAYDSTTRSTQTAPGVEVDIEETEDQRRARMYESCEPTDTECLERQNSDSSTR
ncbi:MAG: hypothetical protein A2622_01580 [Bdellovibrionales bacterium RIFCSPHIGHO2_01_FULL_40_29]|nr:MAG: hypothetical protein A2622_01580 [Bdellovibrionales bacterium RIFCSPHIGHO2_01_FULL_40_29]OFZ33786.1 MAG: hypothetical protein A3D17_02000 [Bdellovibrionales bacterium RIFCSPHIGHO2_02_FULL_40_15]